VWILTSDELDIIDEQHIDLAVFVAEGLGVMGADGVDQVVGELSEETYSTCKPRWWHWLPMACSR